MSAVQDAPFVKKLVFSSLRVVFNAWLYVSTSRLLGAATRPNIIHSYPCRPHLYATRVYKPAEPLEAEKLPLLILLHGGGFVVNNPSKEDSLARYLADTAKCLVASIDYSKSPQNRFPTAYEDVVALSLAVIDDAELPIDKTKVVIAGNSAGGNLALAAVQDPRIHPLVLGVIGLYPVCDASTNCAAKMATRPVADVLDILQSSYDDMLNMYIGPQSSIDLTDPRLSPGKFKARSNLPTHVYLIGVEHDLLAAEAEAMADRLAEGELERRETKQGWRAGCVKWDLIKGQTHGFDQFGNGKAKEAQRLEQKNELYRNMVEWLRQVFERDS